MVIRDCGRKVGPVTPRRPGLEIRMYDRETVELAPCALEEGMARREVAELCGVSRASVGFWAAGRVPHERGAGRIRVGGRTGARDARGAGVNAGERVAYEAAMTENTRSRRCWTT